MALSSSIRPDSSSLLTPAAIVTPAARSNSPQTITSSTNRLSFEHADLKIVEGHFPCPGLAKGAVRPLGGDNAASGLTAGAGQGPRTGRRRLNGHERIVTDTAASLFSGCRITCLLTKRDSIICSPPTERPICGLKDRGGGCGRTGERRAPAPQSAITKDAGRRAAHPVLLERPAGARRRTAQRARIVRLRSPRRWVPRASPKGEDGERRLRRLQQRRGMPSRPSPAAPHGGSGSPPAGRRRGR